MRVVDLSDEYMRFVTVCTHIDDPPNEEMDSVIWVRESWIKDALAKELKVKVAIDDGRPVGFAHCLPIELGACGMSGKDLMTIPCLTLKYDYVYSQKRGSGYGRALVEAIEEEAKREKKGVAVLTCDHDFWLMPSSFFKKLGYQEVAREGRKEAFPLLEYILADTVIMLKAFEPVAPPVMHKLNYQPQLVPGKIVVDAFWSPICNVSIIEIHRVREACAEYGDKVILNEFNCGNKDILEKYQATRALFINGKSKTWGHEAPRDGLRKEIDRALEEMAGGE